MNARIWLAELIALARAHNATVERTRGGHLRIRLPNGATVHTSATPSDHRVYQNTPRRPSPAGAPHTLTPTRGAAPRRRKRSAMATVRKPPARKPAKQPARKRATTAEDRAVAADVDLLLNTAHTRGARKVAQAVIDRAYAAQRKTKPAPPVGPLAYLRATKTKANKHAHLPDAVTLTLDGLSGARGALDVIGWSMAEPLADEQIWPRARIEQYRVALCDEFRRLFGRSWTFTIETP